MADNRNDPELIEQDIERTQDAIGSTIDKIEEKLNPRDIVDSFVSGDGMDNAKQVWSIWAWFTPWAIVTDSDVHNILGPPLPGDDPSKAGEATTDDPARQPFTGLATGHSLIGLWIEQ